ncbi:dCTP pyrophosphatase 1-like isoform X2 [Watersipora subatra]|uniref:dCTP pyrophosphatase 1-like isoform X2 n=1 Tax=Watersipora subatra TaxID=2589382 RepID=UPI00355B5483
MSAEQKSESPAVNACTANQGTECTFNFSSDLSFEQLRDKQTKLLAEQGLDSDVTTHNVFISLVGKVGKVSEVFQWKSEVKVGAPELSPQERKTLEEEMGDAAAYLVRLSQQCHVDLPAVVLDKLERNAVKYPVDKSHGSSAKYTKYSQDYQLS